MPAAHPAAALTRRTLLSGAVGGTLAALLAACTGAASPTANPGPTVATVTGGRPPVSPAATRTAVGTTTRAASATAAPAAATPAAGPRLVVTPTSVLLDDPVTIRLTGLAPGQAATLRARSDIGGQLRDATATFRADATGTVDPATQAPDSGTYSGVDPTGLFWSGIDPYAAVGGAGTPAASAPSGAAALALGTAPTTVTLAAIVDGRTVGTVGVGRAFVAPGGGRRPIAERGLAGTLFTPTAPGPHPGVLVWGGSEGGLQSENRAALLAAHGFAALALAYFAYAGLPPALANIPLEYVGTALEVMAAQPEVRAGRLGVVGESRGSELALLAGTLFPRIGAVVAHAPSAVLWPGVGAGVAADTPAWTYQGQPLPFVPYRSTPVARATIAAGVAAGRGQAETPSFLASLGDTAAVARATIPVERIAGPLLLIAGEADQLWPSGTFAGLIGGRLQQQGHPYPDAILRYPDAGHLNRLAQPAHGGRPDHHGDVTDRAGDRRHPRRERRRQRRLLAARAQIPRGRAEVVTRRTLLDGALRRRRRGRARHRPR